MGGISFIVYSSNNPLINLEFSKAFMNMQSRGPDNTAYTTETNIPINRMNEDNIKMYLSRSEIADYAQYTFMYGYHRMSINDTSRDGEQPFEDPILHKVKEYPELRGRPKRKLMCNGEIYNYKDLVDANKFGDRDLQSGSDVEVIMPMYIKHGLEKTLKTLNGDFSFVLTENINTFEIKRMNAFVARDPLGIKPMYIIRHKREFFYMFVSELKGVPDHILRDNSFEVTEMPPGTYWSFAEQIKSKGGGRLALTRYNDWNEYKSLQSCIIKDTDPETLGKVYEDIREILKKSVMERFDLTDETIPVGVLLSGGFDSCIMLSILVNELMKRDEKSRGLGSLRQIHVFTVDNYRAANNNTNSANNIEDAKRCVEYLEKKYEGRLDLIHHMVVVDIDGQLDKAGMKRGMDGVIKDIIGAIETYDGRMVRSGIMYKYLMKYIAENTNVKVLLSGEGVEELCGHKEFNGLDDGQMQGKSVRLIKYLSKFEMLVGDKISGVFGLECRYPFLDERFVRYMLSLHPRLKRPQAYKYKSLPIEKYIVRKAFDDNNNDKEYLSDDLLWKRARKDRDDDKIEMMIKELMDNLYTDGQFYSFMAVNNSKESKKVTSKEEMHYKLVFEGIFGGNIGGVVPKKWDELWE